MGKLPRQDAGGPAGPMPMHSDAASSLGYAEGRAHPSELRGRPSMITDMASYLRFFDGVRRRTERDVAALPPEAAAWRPPAAAGEAEWTIGQIIGHLGGSRLYFASA